MTYQTLSEARRPKPDELRPTLADGRPRCREIVAHPVGIIFVYRQCERAAVTDAATRCRQHSAAAVRARRAATEARYDARHWLATRDRRLADHAARLARALESLLTATRSHVAGRVATAATRALAAYRREVKAGLPKPKGGSDG